MKKEIQKLIDDAKKTAFEDFTSWGDMHGGDPDSFSDGFHNGAQFGFELGVKMAAERIRPERMAYSSDRVKHLKAARRRILSLLKADETEGD